MAFPTLPADTFTEPKVVRGAGKLYLYDYVTAGGDPSGASNVVDLGPTQGGIDWDPKISKALVECDQKLAAIAAFPIKEEFTFKTNLLDLSLLRFISVMADDWNQAAGTSGHYNRVAGPPIVDTVAIGGYSLRQYVGLYWKGNGSLTGGTQAGSRVIRCWMCTPTAFGELKNTKTKETMLQVTWHALCDVSVTTSSTKGEVGQIIDA